MTAGEVIPVRRRATVATNWLARWVQARRYFQFTPSGEFCEARPRPLPRRRPQAHPGPGSVRASHPTREGKHHIAALIALTRRRIDVLFAMLRDGTFYQPSTPATA